MIRKATKEDTAAIARLHKALLGDSIFVRLGRPFLEGFYYTLLTEDRLAFAYIWDDGGKPVGFIAMAASHRSFYGQIVRRAPALAWSLVKSVASSPKVIFSIAQAVGFLAKKHELIKCDAEGELLQIAVDPDYRVKKADGTNTEFFGRCGVRVARELYREAVQELHRRGVGDFRIMTGDDNVASNSFYAKMGCRKAAGGIAVFGHPTSMYRADVKESLGILHNSGI